MTITAQNGVGIAAQQTLMLNIVGITGVAPTSGAKCNGNYTGTFNGSITVSAGQNCAFYFGGVTGNVSVIGGNFAATGANITGNVSIQGATGFSIGAGTTIAGNLTIQNVASASTTNQVCGTTVTGNRECLRERGSHHDRFNRYFLLGKFVRRKRRDHLQYSADSGVRERRQEEPLLFEQYVDRGRRKRGPEEDRPMRGVLMGCNA